MARDYLPHGDFATAVRRKGNDPRIGETVCCLTNIKRADPDPSLIEVLSGFTTRQGPQIVTRQVPSKLQSGAGASVWWLSPTRLLFIPSQ